MLSTARARPRGDLRAPAGRLTRRRVRGCNSALFSGRADPHETDLSAIGEAPQAHARLPRAYADPWRARCAAGAPRQGAGAIEPLSETGHALPSGARLHRREEFTATLAAGAARVRRYFRLYVRANGLSRARIGIIASRRAVPRAVDRNRMKRLVREVFRTLAERPAGVDIVVELRRSPPRGSSAAARMELARMLQELAAAPRAQ